MRDFLGALLGRGSRLSARASRRRRGAEDHEVFAATWNHTRIALRRGNDDDLSRFDWVLARVAAQARWSNQEIAALIVAHRHRWGGFAKALRPDYIQRT